MRRGCVFENSLCGYNTLGFQLLFILFKYRSRCFFEPARNFQAYLRQKMLNSRGEKIIFVFIKSARFYCWNSKASLADKIGALHGNSICTRAFRRKKLTITAESNVKSSNLDQFQFVYAYDETQRGKSESVGINFVNVPTPAINVDWFNFLKTLDSPVLPLTISPFG